MYFKQVIINNLLHWPLTSLRSIKGWTHDFRLRFFRRRSSNAHITAFSKPIVICM